MTGRDLLDQARASLIAHRLRAALSALGIICGIAAIVAAFAISDGARRQALEDLGALGLRNIYVRAEPGSRGGDEPRRAMARPVPALTVDDAAAVAARIGSIDGAASVRMAPVELRAGARAAAAHLVGVSDAWADLIGARVAKGRWLRPDEFRAGRRVAVVGAALAGAMFDGRDPIGEYVRAGDVWYRVVGVLAAGSARGVGPAHSADPMRAAFVPMTAMDVSRGPGDSLRHVSEIVFRARRDADVTAAARAVEDRLRDRRADAGGFRVVVPRALLDARLRAQRTTRALLVGIGGLALFISGIGIMNIMLASVVERTQEIGIRRAFGATRAEIVRQFTFEAALLCIAGGLAGLPLGVTIAWAVAIYGGWPIAIAPASIAIAIALAGAVGVGAGLYPARRAAGLDPAVALRAE